MNITAKQRDYIVTQDEAGVRLDRFVADKESSLSRSLIQKFISDGRVTIGNSSAKPGRRIHAGDIVRIELSDLDSDTDIRAEDIPVEILFEDDEVIVVNKPAGMVVHPAAGVDSGTLVNALFTHISPELNSIAPGRPGIVHRIDKDTSGVLVVARTAEAYHCLVEQFKEHSITRKYMALICGIMEQDTGIIEAPIGRSRRDRKRMAVTSVHSREAITHFSVIASYREFSLLEIRLQTGRTHQIRVHLSYIGYPVVGDSTYGRKNKAIKLAASQDVKLALEKLTRQALHAQMLGFVHPGNNEYMEFSTPIPADIQNVMDALERDAEV